MKLFGKEESEEHYERQHGFDPKTKVLKDREFKDLNPANKKKRKEPLKPWSRKERLTLTFILLASAGLSAYLYLSSVAWNPAGGTGLPSLKNLSFLGGEVVVLEGNKRDKEKADKAKTDFRNLTKDLAGKYSLYVVRLVNGSSYGVGETELMDAASLVKLPVMAAMYLEFEKLTFNPNSKYILTSKDKKAGAGSLQYKPNGYSISYQELLNLMGKQSDNTAFNIVKNILGKEKIDKTLTEIGMVKTNIENYKTTAYDIGIFFEKLYKGEILTRKYKELMTESLTNTIFEDWLAAGLPEGVKFVHKYGRETNVVNDSGIVIGANPYVIVVMGMNVYEEEADVVFPKIGRIVWEIEEE